MSVGRAVRLVLAHAVSQNRLRRCLECHQGFARERDTVARAGRPACFCSTTCHQRVAGKTSHEKHKDERGAWPSSCGPMHNTGTATSPPMALSTEAAMELEKLPFRLPEARDVH